MTTPAVRFEGISKRFPGARALDSVTFEIAAGSCHALCGENGAGKSTLGKILAGIHSPDAGQLLLGLGHEVDQRVQGIGGHVRTPDQRGGHEPR